LKTKWKSAGRPTVCTVMNPVEPQPPFAVCVPDDAGVRARVSRLLAEAGVDGHVLITVPREGMARVEAIRERADSGDKHAPTIALMPPEATSALLRKALRAGADGILLDDALDTSLVVTARAVMAGQLVVPLTLRRHVAPRPLSHREKQVLALVVAGLTNRQIADRLFLAESTIKTHLSSAFDKLDARSRAEATAVILDPEEGRDLGVLTVAEAESLTST
jgi:DNA-binding NarL/FixJ family response regulator